MCYLFKLILEMSLRKSLPIFVLFAMMSFVIKAQTKQECSGVKLTISVEKTEGNTSAIATVEGASSPVYYIFYYPNGQLVDAKRDVSKNKIENMKPGKYYCSISDNKGCTAKVEFKVD